MLELRNSPGNTRANSAERNSQDTSDLFVGVVLQIKQNYSLTVLFMDLSKELDCLGCVQLAEFLQWHTRQIFRFVVLKPALKAIYPALTSQFILLMLSSSIVSTISAVELTAITNTLTSTTFRSFEFYFVATGLYLAMALGFRVALSGIYWTVFQRGRAV